MPGRRCSSAPTRRRAAALVRRDAVPPARRAASPTSSCARTTRSSTRPTSTRSTSTRWAGSSRTPTSPTSSRNMRPGHATPATTRRSRIPRAARSSTSTRCCAICRRARVALRRAGHRRSISTRAGRDDAEAHDPRTTASSARRRCRALARMCELAARRRACSRGTRCSCSTSASTARARAASTGCTSPTARVAFYRVGWYDNILDGDRMSLYVEIGAPDGAPFDVRRAARARARRPRARRHRRPITSSSPSITSCSIRRTCHITQASLAETARAARAARARRASTRSAATAAGPTARSRTTWSRRARSRAKLAERSPIGTASASGDVDAERSAVAGARCAHVLEHRQGRRSPGRAEREGPVLRVDARASRRPSGLGAASLAPGRRLSRGAGRQSIYAILTAPHRRASRQARSDCFASSPASPRGSSVVRQHAVAGFRSRRGRASASSNAGGAPIAHGSRRRASAISRRASRPALISVHATLGCATRLRCDRADRRATTCEDVFVGRRRRGDARPWVSACEVGRRSSRPR